MQGDHRSEELRWQWRLFMLDALMFVAATVVGENDLEGLQGLRKLTRRASELKEKVLR